MPHYIVPELLPTACGEFQCSQGRNATGPSILPPRSRNAHSLLDHCLTGSLRYRTNRSESLIFLHRPKRAPKHGLIRLVWKRTYRGPEKTSHSCKIFLDRSMGNMVQVGKLEIQVVSVFGFRTHSDVLREPNFVVG